MNNLDNKLREILWKVYPYSQTLTGQESDKAIDLIKQAFADDWFEKMKQPELLLGQEYFNRLRDELEKIDYRGNPTYSKDEVVEAAKKASSIKVVL